MALPTKYLGRLKAILIDNIIGHGYRNSLDHPLEYFSYQLQPFNFGSILSPLYYKRQAECTEDFRTN